MSLIKLEKLTNDLITYDTNIRCERDAFKMMINTIIGGYWKLSLVNNSEYLSDSIVRSLGYSRYYLENELNWKELFNTKDVNNYNSEIENIKCGKKKMFVSILKGKTKDNKSIKIKRTGILLDTKDGNPSLVYGTQEII